MSIKPNSLCILRLTALGDCINAYGMMCAIAKKEPQVAMIWVIDKRFAPLFRDENGKDLIPMLPVDFKQGTIKACLKIKKALHGQSFDALLNMQTSLKSSLCSLSIRARTKFGYDKERSREGQFLFINKKVPSPANPHVLAGFMAFARNAGFDDINPCWDFKLSAKELAPYEELSHNNKLFVIAPASAKAQKNWTGEGYAAIADYAYENGFKVVLAGSPNEKEKALCNEISLKTHCDCLNLCGKTSLRALAALLSCAALVLSPDSASMHLASAVGTPVIGLFAVHDPRRVGSWRYPDLWVSVYRELARKECRQNAHIPWRYRVRDEKAMTHITIDMVKEAFDLALEHHCPGEE